MTPRERRRAIWKMWHAHTLHKWGKPEKAHKLLLEVIKTVVEEKPRG